MKEREIIQHLLYKIEQVRVAQRAYFNSRNPTNLKASKGLEADLDTYTRELRRKGYEPKDMNEKTEQKPLF